MRALTGKARTCRVAQSASSPRTCSRPSIPTAYNCTATRNVVARVSTIEAQLSQWHTKTQQPARLASTHERCPSPWLRRSRRTTSGGSGSSAGYASSTCWQLTRGVSVASTAHVITSVLPFFASRIAESEPKSVAQCTRREWCRRELATSTASECWEQSRWKDAATFWRVWRVLAHQLRHKFGCCRAWRSAKPNGPKLIRTLRAIASWWRGRTKQAT